MEGKDILEFWGINFDDVKKQIEDATKLEGEEFYRRLLEISGLKMIVKDTLEQVEMYERDVKGLINAKAKAVYGNDWQAIKGEKFKITRSKTGSMYLVNGKPNAKFIVTKVTVDSKAVDEFIEENERLPKGIELNDQRGESLRITVQ